MKKLFTIPLAATFFLFTAFTLKQDTPAQKLASVDVKGLDGKIINTSTFSNGGKPIVVSFWATWCAPCKKELNETGVKVIAVSIDDARNSPKVKPYVEQQEWAYEIYLDENQDFKRSMNVNNVPHTFVLNANNEVTWQTNVYNPNGGVEAIYTAVKAAMSTSAPAPENK
jgi:cytochrome c biogenesis protein CcmG, thiol:disulfide interchange protein DsbE